MQVIEKKNYCLGIPICVADDIIVGIFGVGSLCDLDCFDCVLASVPNRIQASSSLERSAELGLDMIR